MQGPQDSLLTAGALADQPDFSLGEATISPSTRTVSGPVGTVVVEPRVMQVLVILSERAGRVVSRDTLFRRCWGGVHVGDDSLNRAISEVRRVARATTGSSIVIQTVPRTGYRLAVAGAYQGSAANLSIRPQWMTRRLVAGAGLATVIAAPLLWASLRDPATAEVDALLAQSDLALRSGLPDSSAQGAGLLEEAVALQQDNAKAWGKLALARCYIAEYAPPQDAAAAVSAAQDAARRAIALDPRQVDAHGALALLPPYYGDWFAAERRMQDVLAIDARHLPTLDALSFLHISVGRTRQGALERIAMAAREPLHAQYQYKLIYAHWMLGRIAEADRAADRALQLWPKHPGAWFGRLWTLAFTGRAARARAHVEDASARPDLPEWAIDTLMSGMKALETRRPADVRRAVDDALGDVSRGPSPSINAILLLAGLGAIDQAFEVAEAYLLERGQLLANLRWRPGQLSVNDQRRRKTNMLFVPVTAPLRADPRFLTLARDMGMADYWRRIGVTPDFMQA